MPDPTVLPDARALVQPSEAATKLAMTATPEDFPRDSYGLALWLDRALATPPASDAPASGAGFVLVPVEPTEAMLAAPKVTSEAGAGLALRAIKAVTATGKDGPKALSRIMAITIAAGVEAPYTDLLADPDVALIVERPRTEWAHLFKPSVDGCAMPPDGWCCTRARGHSGPCAALATDATDGAKT